MNFEVVKLIHILIPRQRTNYLKKSFRFNGGLIWNSISKKIRLSTSFSQFKTNIQAYRFIDSVIFQF